MRTARIRRASQPSRRRGESLQHQEATRSAIAKERRLEHEEKKRAQDAHDKFQAEVEADRALGLRQQQSLANTLAEREASSQRDKDIREKITGIAKPYPQAGSGSSGSSGGSRPSASGSSSGSSSGSGSGSASASGSGSGSGSPSGSSSASGRASAELEAKQKGEREAQKKAAEEAARTREASRPACPLPKSSTQCDSECKSRLGDPEAKAAAACAKHKDMPGVEGEMKRELCRVRFIDAQHACMAKCEADSQAKSTARGRIAAHQAGPVAGPSRADAGLLFGEGERIRAFGAPSGTDTMTWTNLRTTRPKIALVSCRVHESCGFVSRVT